MVRKGPCLKLVICSLPSLPSWVQLFRFTSMEKMRQGHLIKERYHDSDISRSWQAAA